MKKWKKCEERESVDGRNKKSEQNNLARLESHSDWKKQI